MDRLRPLSKQDLPAAAALHLRAFCTAGSAPPPGMAEEFGRVFLENPWVRDDMPPLIYEGKDGSPVGFLGVVPRPMQFRGKRILVAVSTQLMVDPERGDASAALQLGRAVFRGPQACYLADEGSDKSVKLWRMLGGSIVPVFSLRWTKILRPLRFLLRPSEGSSSAARRLLSSAAAPFDALLRRVGGPFRTRTSGLVGSEMDLPGFLASLALSAQGAALSPVYDEATAAWILAMARRKRCHGALRQRLLREGGRVVGSYIYYLRRGSTAQVLFLHASEDRYLDALNHLCADALGQGAAAVSGRLDPRRLTEFSAAGCVLNRSYNWMQFHSREPELELAVQSGDALLTRLEGEWWVAINSEEFPRPVEPD